MDKDKLLDKPFDQYQRYRVVTEILQIIKKQTGKKHIKILDVGGYFKNSKGQDVFPIKEFLPEYEIFVLDIADSLLPHYIQGNATNMPFLQNTFDVVNCQDVLEHIPAKERTRFLGSLLETTKDFMILGAPFKTENSILAEKILFEFILKTLKGRHKELEEHILNGLPECKDVKSILVKKKFKYCEFPSGYLNNWLLMMIVKHYILALPDSQQLSTLIDRFYNIHFYESDQRHPAYRHMFVISKLKKNDYMLKKISDKFRYYQEKYKYLTVEKSNISSLQTLLSLEALKDKNKLEVLNSQIEVLNSQIEALKKDNHDQNIHIQNFKRETQEKKQLIQSQKEEIYNKEVHIRNIETNMEMILNSKVWRLADFFRKIFYMKILKIFPVLQRSILMITREGFRSFWQKVKNKELMRSKDLYDIWIEKNSLTKEKESSIREEIEQFSYKPKFSIILPVYNVDKIWLERAINSVFDQLYENWELCLVDDASTKKHIKNTLLKYENNKKVRLKFLEENRGISGASNEALSLATGEFVGFLDHDDELSIDALYENVKFLNKYPEADLIYSDEDKINPQGRRIEPYFKPDWSPDLLLSYNYICHFSVYRKIIIDKIKRFRSGYEGSQDYDLILRVTEKTDKIFHIPKILYHWRQIKGSTSAAHKEKVTHINNSIKVLQQALQRRGIDGTVEKGINFNQFESYRVKRRLKQKPLISIIIPMKDKISFLKRKINLEKLFINYTVKRVDKVLVLTSSMKKALNRLFGVPYQKTELTFNGIDINIFKPLDMMYQRSKLNLPKDKKIVMALGRLSPEKGFDLLIDAFRKIYKEENLYLVIVGDGPLRTKIEKKIKKQGLSENVLLVGSKPHNEVQYWLNACDLFCSPSYHEEYGLNVIEAMCCGKPIIATSVGIASRVINKDLNGILVPVGSSLDLAHGIAWACHRKWQSKLIASFGSRFSIDKSVDNIIKIFRNL